MITEWILCVDIQLMANEVYLFQFRIFSCFFMRVNNFLLDFWEIKNSHFFVGNNTAASNQKCHIPKLFSFQENGLKTKVENAKVVLSRDFFERNQWKY